MGCWPLDQVVQFRVLSVHSQKLKCVNHWPKRPDARFVGPILLTMLYWTHIGSQTSLQNTNSYSLFFVLSFFLSCAMECLCFQREGTYHHSFFLEFSSGHCSVSQYTRHLFVNCSFAFLRLLQCLMYKKNNICWDKDSLTLFKYIFSDAKILMYCLVWEKAVCWTFIWRDSVLCCVK